MTTPQPNPTDDLAEENRLLREFIKRVTYEDHEVPGVRYISFKEDVDLMEFFPKNIKPLT